MVLTVSLKNSRSRLISCFYQVRRSHLKITSKGTSWYNDCQGEVSEAVGRPSAGWGGEAEG